MPAKLARNPEFWSAIIGFLVVFVGGIFWLSEMQMLAKNNEEAIASLNYEFKDEKKSVNEKIDDQMNKINTQSNKLASIEAKLDIMIELIKRKHANDNMPRRHQ